MGDVYANLSRILETHGFGGDADDFEEFVERVTQADTKETKPQQNKRASTAPSGSKLSKPSPPDAKRSSQEMPPQRLTPYEAWQMKQNMKEGISSSSQSKKSTKQYTARQWADIVEHLYKGTSVRPAKTKNLNNNLAEELGNLDFRPKMNALSLQLSRTMKPLMERIPVMMKKREELHDKRKQEIELDRDAECTFSPERMASKMSDKYLRKSGRDKHKVNPDDLFRYEEEKQNRISIRRKILREMEDKEFTYKPKVNATSEKLKEEIVKRETNMYTPKDNYDESATVTKLLRQKNILAPVSRVGEVNSRVVPGKITILQSNHPYEHNLNEYHPVCVKGALAYSIVFDKKSSTESVYDFIKFYQDDGHTSQWGSGKYCGGVNDTSCNWPGVEGRASLIIPASRFVVHFKTNSKINGWGYKMNITPYFGKLNEKYGDPTHTAAFSAGSIGPSEGNEKLSYQYLKHEESTRLGKPTLYSRAVQYKDSQGRGVYDRLYEEGQKSQLQKHNKLAEQMDRTMDLEYKPWEKSRKKNEKFEWTAYKSHTRKSQPTAKDYITSAINESGKLTFKVVDFHEKYADMWGTLVEADIDLDSFQRSQTKDTNLL